MMVRCFYVGSGLGVGGEVMWTDLAVVLVGNRAEVGLSRPCCNVVLPVVGSCVIALPVFGPMNQQYPCCCWAGVVLSCLSVVESNRWSTTKKLARHPVVSGHLA